MCTLELSALDLGQAYKKGMTVFVALCSVHVLDGAKVRPAPPRHAPRGAGPPTPYTLRVDAQRATSVLCVPQVFVPLSARAVLVPPKPTEKAVVRLPTWLPGGTARGLSILILHKRERACPF